MSTAMGVLGWSPREFYDATMMDFTCALKGFLASKGVDMRPGVTEAEFLEEVARLEQEEKASGVGAGS